MFSDVFIVNRKCRKKIVDNKKEYLLKMLTLKLITENRDEVVSRLGKKHFAHAADMIDKVIKLDTNRRATQKELDSTQAEMNKLSKSIGALMQAGKKDEAEEAKTRTTKYKDDIKDLQTKMDALETEIRDLLLQIPNLPNDMVPEGKHAEDNVVERTGGVNPEFAGFKPLPHWELAKKYDLIDFELGVKITGAGFPIYKGKGARLQRALINFFLDEARDAGYLEIEPPYVVNEASGYGTGQLPDKEGQMYHAGLDNLYLIPTAEVPVTNIYRDVILSEKEMPIKNCAYSACFRREAGSYGKDVRGLNRLHQFNKVEIVRIDTPEHSYDSLNEMIAHVENLVIKLGLPYRILRLCGGDMSFTSAMTFDFEVYSSAQERWLEVSSVSNFESYQANRLKCRYKNSDGKTELCHTLNGSALALPRIVAAILENNQTQNGIRVPECLVPYCGFDIIN
jgi:seryl-tRNA synthetase